MLEIQDITVRTRARVVVDRVSLSASPGEFVAVIGPNGAGKTTLFEALVGLRPARGRVLWKGAPLRRFVDRARVFSYLTDSGELPPELRARLVVDHALGRGRRRAATVDELRRLLGVEPLLSVSCGELSRGERQRVALFCALAVDRPVVVLDEPFGAFDPFHLKDVLGAIRQVRGEGTAIVASIHQIGDAERLADRVLLLAEGRRVAWGTIPALRERAGGGSGSLEDVFVALLERGGNAA